MSNEEKIREVINDAMRRAGKKSINSQKESMEYELILSKKNGACAKAIITGDEIFNRDMNEAVKILLDVVEDMDLVIRNQFVLRKIDD